MKDRGIRLEAFSTSDYDRVKALWVESGLDRSPGDEPEGIEAKLRRDRELFLVARCGGEIVGTVMGAWDGRRGWVYHLAVKPGFRRRGVGSMLLKELEARMRKKGVLKVNAIVYDWNLPSLSLFKKSGFDRQDGQVVVGKYLVPRDA